MDNYDEITVADLERTIQHQADTIEALHIASSKYKNRLDLTEQKLLEREAELSAAATLSSENALLRTELIDLREAMRTLEQSTARIMDKNTLGTETHAQLGVRVQAYQRHNAYLQGELSEREARLKLANDKADMLAEEGATKDRRIAVMLEKLRQHNIDPSSTIASVRVPEETFASMKVKLTSQATTIELLHERVESLMDEAERRSSLVDAVQRENKALRVSVQKLIAQVTQSAAEPMAEEDAAEDGATGGGVVSALEDRRLSLAADGSSSPAGASAADFSGGSPRRAVGGYQQPLSHQNKGDADLSSSGYPAFGSTLSSIEQRLAAFRQRNPKLN